MKKFIPSLLLSIPLLLTGCALTSNSSSVTSGKTYSATSAADISVLFEEPAGAFEVIGVVEGRGSGLTKEKQKSRAIEAMKKEAASIGATAVVITSTHTAELQSLDEDLSGGEETVISGKALRE